MPFDPAPPSPPPESSGPSAVTLLMVAVVLVVGGYFLAVKLKAMSHLQDCVMSGRTNCAAIMTPASQ